MAFYPDELSPIDRVRTLGKSTDLTDINLLKNRRQWKSLVLGKKDMGLNNFATIAEEKEEDISSEDSQDGSLHKEGSTNVNVNSAIVNKKITFPKPRKYITSRVAERKEDLAMRTFEPPVNPTVSLASLKESSNPEKRSNIDLTSSPPASSKNSAQDIRQILKARKSRELVAPKVEFIENFVFNESNLETQWNEAFSESGLITSWQKPGSAPKHDSRSKHEEKRKTLGGKQSNLDGGKQETKQTPKKSNLTPKKTTGGQSPKQEEAPSANKTIKQKTKGKQKPEKGKSLNMKDVVNVYKNLTYGSKEEIKSFVEKLSFVKDEAENDKNLLSVMNLKVLENKIKNFTKKTPKAPEVFKSEEKKKTSKPARKNRKAHIERLARHKVVKVPATSKSNVGANSERASEQKDGKTSTLSSEKEPWKYVGMQSVLDKTYFVYPAYPPSVNLKKSKKKKKVAEKSEDQKRKAEVNQQRKPATALKSGPKVKDRELVLRANMLSRGKPSGSVIIASRSESGKSMSRASATTVCTVEFQPATNKARKPVEDPAATDPSLLVYLHGTKALNVKYPYSDKQFSRVKFFSKDARGSPLIKGLDRNVLAKPNGNVSVRNIKLPNKLSRVRSIDLLDFDEDIENINEFLRSQSSSSQRGQNERGSGKKSEREPSPGLRETQPSGRHQRRPATQQHHHHHHHHMHQQHQQHHHHDHQHGTLSPDSIVNEISKNIQHLQYLPDTEENKKLIAEFFEELERRIETSRMDGVQFQKFPSPPNSFTPIPILGY